MNENNEEELVNVLKSLENDNTEDKVIHILIGENKKIYNKTMNTGGFNWTAFFFGGFYFLSRKVYLIGILLMVFELILDFIVPIWPLSILYRILTGFIFYPIYKKHILEKVKKYNELGYSYDEKIEKAQKEGGQLPVGILITIVILSGIFIFGLVFMVSIYQNAVNIVNNKESFLTENKQYQLEDLKYTIPDDYMLIFDSDKYTWDDCHKTKSYKKGERSVNVSVENVRDTLSLKDVLDTKTNPQKIILPSEFEQYGVKDDNSGGDIGKYIVPSDEKTSEIKEEKINGIIWKNIVRKLNGCTEFSYITEYNNKIYIIEFEDENNTKTLNKEFVGVVNSLRL